MMWINSDNRLGLLAVGALMAAGAPAMAQEWRDGFPFAFQSPRPAVVAIGPGASMSRSFLGVHVVEIDAAKASSLKLKDEVGVEVTGVEPESPAEKAGLKVGDVVVEYQGQRVEGTEQFIRMVRETPVGRNVRMTVHRAGGTQQISANIAARRSKVLTGEGMAAPRAIEIPRMEMWMPDVPRAFAGLRSTRIGIEAEGLSGQLAEYFGVKEGVLVRGVMKNSAAEKAGLKAGDVITKVDQKAVDSPRDLSEVLREKKSVALTVMREKREMSVSVTPEEAAGDRPARAVVQDYRF
jgi:serine protease Do